MKPGRKPLPKGIKRKGIYVKLPPKIVDFLRQRQGSQSQIIVEALQMAHKELRK